MPANRRPRLKRILILAAAVLVLGGLLFWGTHWHYLLGYFRQVVILDSAKPVVKVSYRTFMGAHTEEWRREAENAADPTMFVLDSAPLDGDRFTAKVTFTTVPFHLPRWNTELLVLVEFADGTRGCRFADIPEGRGQEAVVIRLR